MKVDEIQTNLRLLIVKEYMPEKTIALFKICSFQNVDTSTINFYQ